MSFFTLQIGASGLYASERAIETIGHNVANASVDGYTRQRIETAAAPPSPGVPGERGSGMKGSGVVVTAITRLRDQLADVTYRQQAVVTGFAGARSTVLDRAQGILGPLDTGAPDILNKFWQSWNTLNNSPSDPAARQGVIAAGQQLAQMLRDASSQLTDITNDVSAKVSGDVTQVNNLATQVANLNQSILQAEAAGQSPNDLLDSRDRALDQLSQLAGVQLNQTSQGTVDVYLNGSPLVRGNNAYQLVAGQGSDGTPTVSFADGTAANVGGEIGGYLTSTSADLPSLRADLDAIAKGVSNVVNAQHEAGKALDGSQGIAFFVGSDASTIDVNPNLTPSLVAASSSGAANDGNNALAIFQLSNNSSAVQLAGGGTASVGDALRALGGRLGALASGADQANQIASNALSAAATSRASSDGVSTDEEMVDMLKYQHAYQAAARVISVADSMLDTLINKMAV